MFFQLIWQKRILIFVFYQLMLYYGIVCFKKKLYISFFSRLQNLLFTKQELQNFSFVQFVC